jgi:hypothetical protein
MPYETTCPKGHRLQVSDSHLGQRIQCPACNESFVVPDGSRPPAAPRRGNSGRWTLSPAASDLARLARWTGRPLVAFGLLMVLLSKGCDAINLHAAARASAAATAAVQQYDEDQQFKESALQNEIDGLRPRDDAKPEERRADDRKREELRKQLHEYQVESAKDRRSKESGEWHDLRTAARLAKWTFAVNSYWHELFFLFSASVLVLGLLIVGWFAEGAERWMGLAMLAVIIYSLFAGGPGWMPLPG